MDPVGTAGILKIAPSLQAAGFEVFVPDYGLITAIEARIWNPNAVRLLRPFMQPGDIWVGHSNGCAIGYELLITGSKFGGMVLFNPALDPKLHFPDGVWVDVYCNAGDDATVAAQAGKDIGLLDPVWGEMGHSGYEGDNPMVMTVHADRTPSMPVVNGHSDIFSPRCWPTWDPYSIARIKMRSAMVPPPETPQ